MQKSNLIICRPVDQMLSPSWLSPSWFVAQLTGDRVQLALRLQVAWELGTRLHGWGGGRLAWGRKGLLNIMIKIKTCNSLVIVKFLNLA